MYLQIIKVIKYIIYSKFVRPCMLLYVAVRTSTVVAPIARAAVVHEYAHLAARQWAAAPARGRPPGERYSATSLRAGALVRDARRTGSAGRLAPRVMVRLIGGRRPS